MGGGLYSGGLYSEVYGIFEYVCICIKYVIICIGYHMRGGWLDHITNHTINNHIFIYNLYTTSIFQSMTRLWKL